MVVGRGRGCRVSSGTWISMGNMVSLVGISCTSSTYGVVFLWYGWVELSFYSLVGVERGGRGFVALGKVR